MRLFVEASAIQGYEVKLSRSDYHHLKTVQRTRIGETINISVSGTELWTVKLTEFTSAGFIYTLISKSPLDIIKPQITLVQCLPKQDKMSDILRKTTELGISEFIPVVSQRVELKSITTYWQKKQSRWETVILNAAQQSSQPRRPILHPISPLLDGIPTPLENTLCVCFWEEETVTLKSVLDSVSVPDRIVMVIGPEGGLDHTEVDRLKSLGFKTASLGPTVLRVENAALVAAAKLQYAFGV